MNGVRHEAYRDMGVSGAPLGIGGREDGVDEDKGSDDLCSQTGTLIVAGGEHVGAAPGVVVVGVLDCLDQAPAAYGPQALSHQVHHRPDQRHLPRQE